MGESKSYEELYKEAMRHIMREFEEQAKFDNMLAHADDIVGDILAWVNVWDADLDMRRNIAMTLLSQRHKAWADEVGGLRADILYVVVHNKIADIFR